ncbi:hypothetical protein BGX29_009751 [Mortierella sp. GBA35]|nr:hypothetical protein BGX23_002742 [Mortierella sp. AD031]KAF9106334.1 hypothetical protein BGX29_009751 [Mortierella sp. GBA35]KAG0206620.1 hypothetical protein BGX33_007309 [Mortierella sp. NVP41]
MSSIMNAFRSAQTPARNFTSVTLPTTATIKSAFHPEHHPIVLQQLVQSLTPKTPVASSVGESLSQAAKSSVKA